MSNDLSIKEHEIINDLLLVSFTDDTEAIVPIKKLRQMCPCASCAGETDALGNVYKDTPKKLTESSYSISGLQPVGYYGLRPFWADGHSTGIFTVELLHELSQ